MKKITIIGAGLVGTAIALRVAELKLADMVLVDVADEVAQGKAIDLRQAACMVGSNTSFLASSDYSETKGSDIVVVAASAPYSPDMRQEETIAANVPVVRSVVRQAVDQSPGAVFLVVSGPVDAMAYTTWKVSGLPSRQVIGMSGLLLSARLQTVIGHALGISAQDVRAMVLGGNGQHMIPLLSHTSVYGVPVEQLLPREITSNLCKDAASSGAEIASLLGSATASLAPAVASAQMISALLAGENRLIPCSVNPEGKYSLHDIYLGLPAIVGCAGVKDVIELPLSASDQVQLQEVAGQLRKHSTLADQLLLAAKS